MFSQRAQNKNIKTKELTSSSSVLCLYSGCGLFSFDHAVFLHMFKHNVCVVCVSYIRVHPFLVPVCDVWRQVSTKAWCLVFAWWCG